MEISLSDLNSMNPQAHRELLTINRENARLSVDVEMKPEDEIFNALMNHTKVYLTPDEQIICYGEDPSCRVNIGLDAWMLWDEGSGLWIPLEDQSLMDQELNSF